MQFHEQDQGKEWKKSIAFGIHICFYRKNRNFHRISLRHHQLFKRDRMEKETEFIGEIETIEDWIGD